MTVATVKERVKKNVLSALRGTTVGRELAKEEERAEARMAERRAARAKFEAGEALRATLPTLEGAVRRAEAKYRAETERLALDFCQAQRKFREVAQSSSVQRSVGESTLRATADRVVHEHGPVVQAVRRAMEHARTHVSVELDMVRRLAKLKPLTKAPEDVGPIEDARAEVLLAEGALERIEALEFALAELHDLALLVEGDPGTVREVVEACPVLCECGAEFGIDKALDGALAEEVTA